jgi:hypothetical protein
MGSVIKSTAVPSPRATKSTAALLRHQEQQCLPSGERRQRPGRNKAPAPASGARQPCKGLPGRLGLGRAMQDGWRAATIPGPGLLGRTCALR